MKPFAEFSGKDRSFWANIKLISETLGYSDRKTGRLKRYSVEDMIKTYQKRNIAYDHIYKEERLSMTELGRDVLLYLNRRSQIIEENIQHNLMDRDEARKEFDRIRERVNPNCYLPMNKQKGEKRHHMYLTCIVNMLTEEVLGGVHFDDNPKGLVVITKDGKPLRTFSRWMDGAYPGIIDPIAVWETKEYYGTTTFGSRVADGVYETMLDGLEFLEVKIQEERKINHYLIVDDRFTWWTKGKSYLCRIVDILNMGLVNEVLVGREVISRWPEIVRNWQN